jgi:predicted MFS family arabinose efflux permease
MAVVALPRSFGLLAGANLAAQSAEQLSLAATPIVAVLLLGAGPGEVGVLATAQTIPFLLLSIPFGLLADRSPRRALMVAAELLRALALLGLVLAVLADQVTMPVLVVLGFVGAIGTVGFSVTAPALVPALVPPGQLAQANGRLELARSLAFAAGPAAGGALVAWAGAGAAFVLATVLSGVAVALLLRLREPVRQPVPARHPWAELKEGGQMVWGHALLRPILVSAVAWNISWFVLQAAFVPYAMRTLGLDAAAVGLTLAAYGGGMVVGAAFAARLVAAMPFGRAIQFGPLVSVVAALLMVATLVVPSAWLASVSFFLFGAGPIIWTITSITLRQTVTPQALLGRVSSIFLTVNMGARPLGAALGGVVGAAWGESACLVLAFAGFCLQAVLISRSVVSRLRTLPRSS